MDADVPVSRAELERLVAPLIERSLGACQTVLERNRVSADDVGRVVFVGGPTLMPALRARIGGFFGGRVGRGDRPDDPGRPGRGPLCRHRGLERAAGRAGRQGGPRGWSCGWSIRR